MDSVIAAGPNAMATLPAGISPHQIVEKLPPLAGPNRAQYDLPWDNLISNCVRHPGSVVPDRDDVNTPTLPGEIYPHLRYHDLERHEYNSCTSMVD